MDKKSLNSWLTLTANVGVIAGIFFLALEIRQSNQIALVANETEIRKSYADHLQAVFTNKESASLLARATQRDADFDDAEIEMLGAYVFTYLNIWAAVEIGYDNGMLPRLTYDDVEDDIHSHINYYPAMHSIFLGAMDDYPSGKDSDVYRMISEALDKAD